MSEVRRSRHGAGPAQRAALPCVVVTYWSPVGVPGSPAEPFGPLEDLVHHGEGERLMIESTFATIRLRQRLTKGPAPEPPGSPWPSHSSKLPKPGAPRHRTPPGWPSSAPASPFTNGTQAERPNQPSAA